MPKTENINIRIEPELKKESEKTLNYLGLTMAEAIKLFFESYEKEMQNVIYVKSL